MSGCTFSLQQAVAVLVGDIPWFHGPCYVAFSPGNELIGGEFDQPGMGFVNMKVCDSCTHSDFQISLFSLWNGIALTLCNWFIGIITSTIRNRSLLKSVNKLW